MSCDVSMSACNWNEYCYHKVPSRSFTNSSTKSDAFSANEFSTPDDTIIIAAEVHMRVRVHDRQRVGADCMS